MSDDRFDAEEAARRRDEAMQRSLDEAHEYWKKCAAEIIRYCAQTIPYFTTDHTEYWMDQYFPGVTTHKKNAWGPLLIQAANDGLVHNTHTTHPSVMPVNHRRPKTIWASLISASTDT